MAERYSIKVKVISQQGFCAAGHKVKDEFVINRTTPSGICLSAFGAFFPRMYALMFGAVFPWSQDPDVVLAACPDPKNPVVFEFRRIRD